MAQLTVSAAGKILRRELREIAQSIEIEAWKRREDDDDDDDEEEELLNP